MKKSYLILAAVAGLLASCSNEVLVDEAASNTSAPRAIGFSTFSEKATRGDVTVNTNLEFYHNTFAVYGTKVSTVNTTEDPQYVFGDAAAADTRVAGTVCTYDDGNFYGTDWKYEPVRYWDRQATYSFMAYAPAAAPIQYVYKTATSAAAADDNDFTTAAGTPYVLYGQNVQDGDPKTAELLKGFTASDATTVKDIDILVSDKSQKNLNGNAWAGTPRAAGAGQFDVQLAFHHILAKLNVNFAKAASLDNAVVTIKSVKVENLMNQGEYSELAYNATTPKSGWSSVDYSATPSTYVLWYNKDNATTSYKVLPAYAASTFTHFIESIVMPQTIPANSYMTVVYTITTGTGAATHTEEFTYRLDIQPVFVTFFDRTNYTINFTINPSVITFDPSVDPWLTSTSNQYIL